MELLAVNVAGKAQRKSLMGKDYLVVPMTIMTPGVRNGSRGPLLYGPDFLQQSIGSWNGIPIVRNHPSDSTGSLTTGRSPEILNKHGLGYLFNETRNGKLAVDGWFDIDACDNVDTRIVPNLKAGKAMELSTGLSTENKPANNGDTYNGVPYTSRVVGHTPDHLALLLDSKGACSIQHGCGVFNEQGEPVEEPTLNQKKSLWSKLFEVFNSGPDEEEVVDNETSCSQATEMAMKASQKANESTLKMLGKSPANVTKGEKDTASNLHRAASVAHASAGMMNDQAGNKQVADNHRDTASRHSDMSYRVNNEEITNKHVVGVENGGPGSGPQGGGKGDWTKGGATEGHQEGDRVRINPTYVIGGKSRTGTIVATSPSGHFHTVEYKSGKESSQTIHHESDLASMERKSGANNEQQTDSESDLDIDNSELTDNQEFDMDRKATISYITTNCDCYKGDEETLNKKSDEQLTKIETHIKNERATVDKLTATEAILNAGVEVQGGKMVFNAEKKLWEPKPAEKKEDQTQNMESNQKMVESVLGVSVEEAKQALTFTKNTMAQQKADAIKKLVANTAKEQQPALIKVYEGMDFDTQLKPLINALPAAPVSQERSFYGGAAVGNGSAANEDKPEPLGLPVWNWDTVKASSN